MTHCRIIIGKSVIIIWKIKSDDPRKWLVSWPGPDHGFWQISWISEPNSSKIARLKTLLASWFRSKYSKNFKKSKKWKFCVYWWFSRPLSSAKRCKLLFEKCLFAGNRWHEIRKKSLFFVRRPRIFIPGNMKNTFLRFFNSNAILLWKNTEKTLKFNKNHQLVPNWRQNRRNKKMKNQRKMSIKFKIPLTISQ